MNKGQKQKTPQSAEVNIPAPLLPESETTAVNAARYDALMMRLNPINAIRRYSRDEMNER
ncbi:MAG: hypothetical protein R3E79_08930 [Caldilineaceae bacterium]